MSLSEELSKKLEALKRSAQEFSIFANSIESKKLMKETDVSSLQSKVERLKAEYDAQQNKAALILSEANDEAQGMRQQAKKILEDAISVKNQAAEDVKTAQRTFNEAQALMTQALQKQKEADNMYNTYFERKRKMEEVLR